MLPDFRNPKPEDAVVRNPNDLEISPVHLTVTSRRKQSRALASPFILLYAFASLVLVGTLLLMLPVSSHGEGFTPIMDAFFTATSAVTVTGLVIQNTAVYWTRVGQVFILALMFVGGLGFMTIATILLILVGRRVSLKQRVLIRDSFGINQLGNVVGITLQIAILAIIIQILGFTALFARFSFMYSSGEAVWQALFHAVSGFNNAGFIALNDVDGFGVFSKDVMTLAIMAILILLGSMSYWVLKDLIQLHNFSKFTLNSKLVICFTLILTILGTTAYLVFEYSNVETIGMLSFKEKIVISLFESISGRTAGFSTVGFGHTEHHTNFFFTSLMFVGGASASVAGGVKINTIAIVVLAIFMIIRGNLHVSVFGREIPNNLVLRSMVIVLVAMLFVFLITFALMFFESSFYFREIFFETISAVGTVGLTTGITPYMSSWGHSLLIIAMFFGKIGPLTLALAMAQGVEYDVYRYAKERVNIG